MSHSSKSAGADHPAPASPRAVAYYRQSAREQQENSIPNQRERIRQWAEKNGVEIVEEFSDSSKSEQTAPGP